jgi:hypothetical protein
MSGDQNQTTSKPAPSTKTTPSDKRRGAKSDQKSDQKSAPDQRSERDLRPFYQRENLTRSEWLEIARVVDLQNIPAAEIQSLIVAKSVIADASKDRRLKLARSGSIVSDLLLADASEDVVDEASRRASDRAILHALEHGCCHLTAKAVDSRRVARNTNLDRMAPEGLVAALMLKTSDFVCGEDQSCSRRLSPGQVQALLGRIGEVGSPGIFIAYMRGLSSSSPSVVRAMGDALKKLSGGYFVSFLNSVSMLLRAGILSDEDVTEIVCDGAGERREIGGDAVSPPILKLASMVGNRGARLRMLALIDFSLMSRDDRALMTGSAYTFLSLERGEVQKILDASSDLTGAALMTAFEAIKMTLVRYAAARGGTDFLGDSGPHDDLEGTGLRLENTYQSYDYDGRRGRIARKRPVEMGLLESLRPDGKYADAAVAIMDSAEWHDLVRRVERAVHDAFAENPRVLEMLANGDLETVGYAERHRRQVARHVSLESVVGPQLLSRLRLAAAVAELLLLESGVDHDRLIVILGAVRGDTQLSDLSGYRPIDATELPFTILKTMPRVDTEQRRHLVAAIERTGAPMERYLPLMTPREIVSVLIKKPGLRLSQAIERDVAQGLSTEEFWQLVMHDNTRVRMLGYQLAHHFIGRRSDLEGGTASVKDLVRIMVSGGAVGDKELNSHIAKLCDLGADLSVIAMTSSIYRLLDLGADSGHADDEALLASVAEFQGLGSIQSHSLKKALIERGKGDREFFSRLKAANPRLAAEIGGLPAGASHSESAQFIKDIIFSRRSSILDYHQLDPEVLEYFARHVLSLVPRQRRSEFFFSPLGWRGEYIKDAVSGIRGMLDDSDVDVSGRIRTADMKREFLLSSLAAAIQTGRIEITPKGIHDEIAVLNRKLRSTNVPLFDVQNPHPAYQSKLADGVEFTSHDGERECGYAAKIIASSHDKLEWGEELSFCVGNDTYTTKARTGRYFYVGVYAVAGDGRPKKHGVIEIATTADGSHYVEQAKLKSNQSMPSHLQGKVLRIFNAVTYGAARDQVAAEAPF